MQEIIEEWSTFDWVRASDIPELVDEEGRLRIFPDNIEPSDIRQGFLSDCYFLSALSVLAERQDRIRKLFVSDQVNMQGIFGMYFTKNGARVEVIVDDFIPCKN